MDKIWLASYPPGTPETIEPQRYRSLVDLLDGGCREFAHRPALASFGARLDYATLDRLARDFAAYLQGRCAIKSGDRIGLMMPNMLAYPVALLGALRAGAVVVNCNPLYTASELAHQLGDAGVKTLIAFEHALPTVAVLPAAVAPTRVIVTRIGDFMPRWRSWLVNFVAQRRAGGRPSTPAHGVGLPAAVTEGARLDFSAPPMSHDDLAFLQYTGGTTGRAKGAMLTHGNVVANVLQAAAWFEGHVDRGHEVVLTALPLYHIYALTANCFTTIATGGLNCLITDPRNLDGLVRELGRVPFSTMTGVNTLFAALLDHPDFLRIDFSALKFTSAGGMAVQRTVAERWHAVTGCVLAEGYGLTEASPVVTVNRFDIDAFTGSIGLPVPSTEVRVVDDAGQEVAVGEDGELQVRGPQVMRGYWNDPVETARVIGPDGWLRTGDIARFDAGGYFYLIDRKKDVIVVSGFNVYPAEIEDVVAAHPDVREVAAFGVPDARSGESVCLVVVRANPSLTTAAVLDWCRTRLTAYKIPRSVEFVETLPKSTVGKILKCSLRERYAARSPD